MSSKGKEYKDMETLKNMKVLGKTDTSMVMDNYILKTEVTTKALSMKIKFMEKEPINGRG